MLELIKYNGEKDALCELIKKFWIAHNDYTPTDAEALEDCKVWTGEGHVVYFIAKESETIGYRHRPQRLFTRKVQNYRHRNCSRSQF